MDSKLSAPAALRNRQPILEVLADSLPPTGSILEIASGTGQHAVWFARHLPGRRIQPSDPDPELRASIEAWRLESELSNLRSPLDLDVRAAGWELLPDLPEDVTTVVCINMIHIAPWAATLGLLRGAGSLLPAGGRLLLYGPYREHGRDTAPSNVAFDASLKQRNPEWGVRNLEDVQAAAEREGLELHTRVAMPANNLSVVLHKSRRLS